jgi:hypothetical protein
MLRDSATYKRCAELEAAHEKATILRRAALLDVKLGESHEVPVGEPNQ